MVDFAERRTWRRITGLHKHRKFSLTNRQEQLYDSLLSTSCPPDGHDSGADRLTLLGYGGAMGGGKTRAIAELAIDAALAFPGNNVLVARHHLSDLSSTTMKEFFAHCPTELIDRRQQAPTQLVQLRLPEWPEGQTSTVNFRHLSDWRGLGSQQYGAVLIDEAGQVEEDAALMLLTRLRHPAQHQRWFVAASNPWPGWFQRWFVQRELPEDALRAAQGQVTFIPARIEDNPHLPENYAEVNHALMPPAWRERFIEGRFDALLGRVYPDFDPNMHRWEQPLPQFTYLIGGLDFGGQTESAHHTAAIVAGLVSPSRPPSGPLSPRERARVRAAEDFARYRGKSPNLAAPQHPTHPYTLIRLAEFEDRGPGVIQRLEQWQQACQRRHGRIRWAADRSQSAWIDHQRRQGIDVVPASGAPGSILYGVNLVHERLASDPPRSFYLPELTQFPRRMSEYVWQSGDDPDPKPRKQNDDLIDADRYMHELLQQVPRPFRRRRVQIVQPPLGRDARWREP
ncbi:MAG: phage terminase large subunit [Chloroflexota bacterium]|nr:phage terminase large subunit [Chloroflexota bacterium]MDE2894430.1 phage terminase large subunit [Chloroflexota bacterium]